MAGARRDMIFLIGRGGRGFDPAHLPSQLGKLSLAQWSGRPQAACASCWPSSSTGPQPCWQERPITGTEPTAFHADADLPPSFSSRHRPIPKRSRRWKRRARDPRDQRGCVPRKADMPCAPEIAALQERLVEAGSGGGSARKREAGRRGRKPPAGRSWGSGDEKPRSIPVCRPSARALPALAGSPAKAWKLNAPPALAVTPEVRPHRGRARAAGLLDTIATGTGKRRAQALRADIEALQALRAELAGQRRQVDTAREALDTVRGEVEELIAAQKRQRGRTRPPPPAQRAPPADDLARQARRIAAEAQSFRQLWDEIKPLCRCEPASGPAPHHNGGQRGG